MPKVRRGSVLKTAAEIPDDVLFELCERFIAKSEKTPALSDWLTEEGFNVSREQVYGILRKGLEKNYLRLYPPLSMSLEQRLADRFDESGCEFTVAGLRENTAVADHLGLVAATRLMQLIRELADEGKKKVHIGMGAGGTTQRVAYNLGMLLRTESSLPALAIHALSSGFSVANPRIAPVTFFSYFEGANTNMEYYGLFAPAVVRSRDYAAVKKLPGVHESFDAAKKIDIIVTSLAGAEDPHGLLNIFLAQEAGAIDRLRAKDWCGDLQWRPYSPEGPLDRVNTAIKAVTLFELDELVKLAARKDKHVMVVGSPCLRCGRTKTHALRPLLRSPLLRIPNYLILDSRSAEGLLADQPA